MLEESTDAYDRVDTIGAFIFFSVSARYRSLLFFFFLFCSFFSLRAIAISHSSTTIVLCPFCSSRMLFFFVYLLEGSGVSCLVPVWSVWSGAVGSGLVSAGLFGVFLALAYVGFVLSFTFFSGF